MLAADFIGISNATFERGCRGTKSSVELILLYRLKTACKVMLRLSAIHMKTYTSYSVRGSICVHFMMDNTGSLSKAG